MNLGDKLCQMANLNCSIIDGETDTFRFPIIIWVAHLSTFNKKKKQMLNEVKLKKLLFSIHYCWIKISKSRLKFHI